MKDKNKELMLKCGSKTGAYMPQSPDDPLYRFRYATDPEEKAIAWVVLNTMAFRHESPFCVDEHGRALYIKDMAAACEWSPKTAQNICYALGQQGRIRLKDNKIWYCADIPVEKKGRMKGEEVDFVQSQFPSYVVEFIKTLHGPEKAKAIATLNARKLWRRTFLAELMAQGRSIADQEDDTTYQEIGIPKKHLPKRREARPTWVQVKLATPPEFVQGQPADSVQNRNSGSYKVESDFVDARAAFKTEEEEERVSAAAASTTHSRAAAAVDLEYLSKELRIDDDAARQLAEGCRQIEPSITAAEIVELGNQKLAESAPQIKKGKILNPVGFLIKQLPKMCTGPNFRALRTRMKQEAEQAARRRQADLQCIRDDWETMDPEEREQAILRYPELAADRRQVA